jgi:hypothetical protein
MAFLITELIQSLNPHAIVAFLDFVLLDKLAINKDAAHHFFDVNQLDWPAHLAITTIGITRLI